jgi:hypothetical protein
MRPRKSLHHAKPGPVTTRHNRPAEPAGTGGLCWTDGRSYCVADLVEHIERGVDRATHWIRDISATKWPWLLGPRLVAISVGADGGRRFGRRRVQVAECLCGKGRFLFAHDSTSWRMILPYGRHPLMASPNDRERAPWLGIAGLERSPMGFHARRSGPPVHLARSHRSDRHPLKSRRFASPS